MSFIAQKRSWFIFSFISVFLVAVAVVLFTPSTSPAKPVIEWNPDSIEETISPGGSKTVNVIFTSSKNLSNIEVKIVPELKPFIQVEPEEFKHIRKNRPVNLTLTISASQDSPLGSFDGTIKLKVKDRDDCDEKEDNDDDVKRRRSRTIAKPLPVEINIWQSAEQGDLLFYYPSVWKRDSRFIESRHPILIDNFGNSYGQGGIIPKEGAKISFTRRSLQTTSVDDEIAKDSIDATIQSADNILVAGINARRVSYLIPFAPLYSYSNVIVYIPLNDFLYKISLLYHEGASDEAAFLADFQKIIDAVDFMP